MHMNNKFLDGVHLSHIVELNLDLDQFHIDVTCWRRM